MPKLKQTGTVQPSRFVATAETPPVWLCVVFFMIIGSPISTDFVRDAGIMPRPARSVHPQI
jgi:hypothetical protein